MNYNIEYSMTHSFKDKPLDKRIRDFEHVRSKYPDRIPVIVEKAESSDLPAMDKKKFLVPMDLTVGNFLHIVRKRVVLPPEFGLYLFVGNDIPPTASLMGTIYETYKDKEDGFLYIEYSGESTYGF